MARRARDYAAEYARRQELARQRGFRSYGERRYRAEKAKKVAAEDRRAWPKSTFQQSKRPELHKYTWYYRTQLKMDDGTIVYRTMSIRRNRNLTRGQLRNLITKQVEQRHRMGNRSMGLGDIPTIVSMELESAYHA